MAGAQFLSLSAPIDRDRLGLVLGVDLDFDKSASAHIRYNASLGYNAMNHDVSAGPTLKF
ncbi:MAG: hypothetical protein AAF412_09505 [Pseudomonadota bacterium]